MLSFARSFRVSLAAVALTAVGLGSTASLSAAPGSTAPASAAAAAPIVWPMTLTTAGGTIVLYEPQVRSWPQYTQMTGVAAIAVTLPGATAPAFGTLAFSSLASADVPSGFVSLVNPKLDATNWPTAPPADVPALDAFVKANLHLEGKPLLPLAMVLASIPPAARPHTVPVRANPPVIYVSQRPAVLIVFDGKPVFAPIAGTPFSYAVNTHWQIIHDPASASYYVHAKTGWYQSPGAAGPFTPTVAPASFATIPATGPLAYLPAALKAPKPTGTIVPRVIVSMEPAVLIDMTGQPQFASIPGTQLRYVTNTDKDVFFSRDTTQWYILIAGRWFSAMNLNGPWTFASKHLPADFQKIPEDSPRGRVLVSVPGTTQAFYAASTAQVPHVTAVSPSTTLAVVYSGGAPKFAPIAGTPLMYALNTNSDVIKVDDTHYVACDSGVWFAASSAMGPWSAAAYVPAVVYTIPESSPMYHVTFVHVYDGRGVAMTAAPATPVPQPKSTYQTFAPSQFSNGDAAAYYNQDTTGYLGGYAPTWGGYAYGTGYYNPGYVGVSTYFINPPTYGNYNDTTFARQQAAAGTNGSRGAVLESQRAPAHGPRSIPGPNTNVYAADDGVYRAVAGAWQKNAGGDQWAAAVLFPDSLRHDLAARLDGYRGTVSMATP